MAKDVIRVEYEDHSVYFMEDGWFNATEAAAMYDKRPVDWLRLPDTEKYIDQLCKFHNVTQSHFVKTRRGKNGGTWLHPRLAVLFARWCDVRFAIWCDEQIDQLLRNRHPHFDWKKMRSEAAASFKVMNEALQLIREEQGKATKAHNYMNESKLINGVLTGNFKGMDRNNLSHDQLKLLGKLEIRNSVLISRGLDYATRKSILLTYIADNIEEIEMIFNDVEYTGLMQ